MLAPTLIVLTVLAFVWLGYEGTVRLFGERARSLEAACATFSVAACAWVASAWLPALIGRLDRPAILARTTIVAIVAAVLLVARLRRKLDRIAGGWLVVPFVPVAAWGGFVAWRSALVPPLSHDALSYHLPRAVLWMRRGGFAPIPETVDARMRILPANYEMLLADVMLLGGGDTYTEWIGVFFFVAFVVACGALVQRWWGGGGAMAATVMLLSASVPVLLLHTGADKNDIMTGFFMVAAMVWAGRFFTTGDAASLFLCGLTTVAAIGTKPQPLMLAAPLLPIVIWRARKLRMASVARVVAVVLLASTLLGGAFYIAKLLRDPSVQVSTGREMNFVAYDDWANLWQGPWVLLTAPFSDDDAELEVPGSEPWFWQRYELYFSHLGAPFAICALLIPVAAWRFRGDAPETARERIAMSIAAAVTLLLMLPVRDVPMPRGIYTTALPRYTLYLVPVVFGLTIAPAMARLAATRTLAARLVVYALAGWFVNEAVVAAVRDRFVPLQYVLHQMREPSRAVPFDPYRAAGVVDQVAGPHDVMAFDAGYAAWIQPAFGERLTRPVVFLDPSNIRIPRNARWVIIDRSFAVFWQHPEFRHSSQYLRYLTRGTPTEEDTRVLRALMRDPRFKLVYYIKARNQAVFRVIG